MKGEVENTVGAEGRVRCELLDAEELLVESWEKVMEVDAKKATRRTQKCFMKTGKKSRSES